MHCLPLYGFRQHWCSFMPPPHLPAPPVCSCGFAPRSFGGACALPSVALVLFGSASGWLTLRLPFCGRANSRIPIMTIVLSVSLRTQQFLSRLVPFFFFLLWFFFVLSELSPVVCALLLRVVWVSRPAHIPVLFLFPPLVCQNLTMRLLLPPRCFVFDIFMLFMPFVSHSFSALVWLCGSGLGSHWICRVIGPFLLSFLRFVVLVCGVFVGLVLCVRCSWASTPLYVCQCACC
jgi:hypothetical protein